ncbi:glycosyltransferase [Providencia rettgeri]
MINISILTINYNNASGLKCTLESINKQKLPSGFIYELIIVDGLSSDESLDIIQKYTPIVDTLICEKDNGIYDAMNKGISHANGQYLLFLNSGDYFSTPDAFEIINSRLKTEKNNNKVIFWPVKNITESGDYWYFPKKNIKNIKLWLKNNVPNHQAMLFPKAFYSYNKYNLEYKIASDLDYKYRCMQNFDSSFINESITNFSIGGVSSSPLDFNKYQIILKDSYLFYDSHYHGLSKQINKSIVTIKFSIKLLISYFLKNYYIHIIRKIKGYK